MDLFPIPPNEENPYVDAFWKWWPDLYPNLKVFRMTGGEPLVDHNTFRILNYIEEHPNRSLELAITSNLCPPEKMMNRFTHQISNIIQKKHILQFMIFPSIDTWGPQAEYIRHGLDINDFEKNVRRLLGESPNLLMSFILTTNALSVFNLKTLLKKILEWAEESSQVMRRVFFDLPYLHFPPWQALDILPDKMAEGYLKDGLAFMEENQYHEDKKRHGFSPFQINKMKRLLALVERPVDREKQKINRINFYKFFNEHDCRRGTDFLHTFPELRAFWFDCKELAHCYDRKHPS